MAAPLVLTKLRAPALRARIIPRARLMDRLAGEHEAGFILVCAPAGYGKTTLLAEWAQSLAKSGTAVAWYALDPGDDDPIPFGAYLVAGFIQALGPVDALVQAAQLLRSTPELDLAQILPAIINAAAASGRGCCLILDDYHLISSPAVHSALAYLIEHRPENLRIVIGSRSDPPLPLARLRARGQMAEIRIASLRFTADETARFLNEAMRLDLSPEGVATLAERTEGWVAGLQMAALSLAGRADREQFIASFTGSHRYLVEYLMEEVINRQPAEVQAFLLATSILERLCAPLCDVLTAATRSDADRAAAAGEAVLQALERANLFVIALDDEGTWFRYHHLFREFLQKRLQKQRPEDVPALHRAACAWLAENGLLREAAAHAFQTHDWEYAAAFVEQNSFTMIIHSDIATIYEWCSAFPESVMQNHPLLSVHQCWALVFSFRRQNRERVEARLRQVEPLTRPIPDDPQARALREMIVVLRAFLSMTPDPAADARAQLALGQQMMAAYPEGDPGRFSGLLTAAYAQLALNEGDAAEQAFETARQLAWAGGLYFGIAESTFHLARLAHTRGQLRRAAAICGEVQAAAAAVLAHPEQELPALGCLDIAAGCVLLEQDQRDQAEQRLVHGLDLIGYGMNPYYLLAALTALSRLRAAQGRTEEALQHLDRLEATWPDIGFCTRGLRVMLALRDTPHAPSALAEAAAWSQSPAANGFSFDPGGDMPPPGMGPFGAAEVYYLATLTWLRLQVALGNTRAVRPTLERLLNRANASRLTTRVIELTLVDALAREQEGDHPRARAAVERTLALGQPEGYIRVFDQGPDLLRLLEEVRNCGVFPEYSGQILAALAATPASTERAPDPPGPGDPGQPTAQALIEPLSERELEVLRWMARGASNQAIADALFITVGTVKSHINHILGKLAARNRTEAAARARDAGLIEI